MIPVMRYDDGVNIILVNTNVIPPKSFPFHEAQGIMRFKQELEKNFVEYSFNDSTLSEYNAIGIRYYNIEYDSDLGMAELSHRMLLWQHNNAYVEYFK